MCHFVRVKILRREVAGLRSSCVCNFSGCRCGQALQWIQMRGLGIGCHHTLQGHHYACGCLKVTSIILVFYLLYCSCGRNGIILGIATLGKRRMIVL